MEDNPPQHGLIEPGHDACGLGFIAQINGTPSHDLVTTALGALAQMEHRGAVSADGRSGDGSGVLTQVPQRMLRRWVQSCRAEPAQGPVAIGMVFLPQEHDLRQRAIGTIESLLVTGELKILGWRDVPHSIDVLGPDAQGSLPCVRQVFASWAEPDGENKSIDDLETRLYIVRRRMQRALARDISPGGAYVCSLSAHTVAYKALCRASTLSQFYPDLADEEYESAAAVFHRRFSTNTAPAWPWVQPLRMCAHNGEFNTLQGNLSWLRAREHSLSSPVFGDATRDLVPLADPMDSDSVNFDRLFELLVRSGRKPEAVMTMLCPEPYAHMPDMDASVRAMCRYYSEAIEPWDGPAGIVFFDGRTVGAGLDRNGLRPMRYAVTSDGLVVGGSEAGMFGLDEERITEKGRLGPGHVIAADLRNGTLRRNDEIKIELGNAMPFTQWVERGLVDLVTGRDDRIETPAKTKDLARRQLAAGYGREDLERVIEPMWRERKTPVGSMGDDTPLAALSSKPQSLFRFFKQRFAQVTNPPIDPVRERLNMSLETSMGRYANILDDCPETVELLRLDSPIISDHELEQICGQGAKLNRAASVATLFDPAGGGAALESAIEKLCETAVDAAQSGVGVLILTDRGADETLASVPMLLAVSAVHHRLVDTGLRFRLSLICDTAEAREDHHFACLIGFGATLVLPHLALDTVRSMADEGGEREALAGYREAVESGILKIMSKMGVTVIQSYRGARLFEIVGLSREVINRFFPFTPCPASGIGLNELAEFQAALHEAAFGEPEVKLSEAGVYRFRSGGELHANAPAVFKQLHKAVRTGNAEEFEKYSKASQAVVPVRVRDLVEWGPVRPPVGLDEVEPADRIIGRLCSQAMSHGALSREVHELIAIATNRIGAKSNSGEGGEADQRFTPYTVDGKNPAPEFHSKWSPKAGDLGNSPIKQIAAGRFGVSAEYLASGIELEIKMAQGAKPGEGGQIPGFKVSAEIADQRHTSPGTSLISPPPHHDIYSIEDLAQLIHDLKRVNPRATVTVKLVSTSGIGTIACGVAKAGADTVMISGADGGTGAAGLSSIKHAGLSWEFGLAKAQQQLVANRLRERVKLRVDGGFQTGRDVIIAALLGADEMGFGTAVLIAAGCVMARRCHDNSCPVGSRDAEPEAAGQAARHARARGRPVRLHR